MAYPESKLGNTHIVFVEDEDGARIIRGEAVQHTDLSAEGQVSHSFTIESNVTGDIIEPDDPDKIYSGPVRNFSADTINQN